MQAEYKLKEARYFLRRLKDLRMTSSEPVADEDTFNVIMYNLSAFVSAWGSVFDVLLYDYAERYFKVNREEKIQIRPENFIMAARAIKSVNPEAEKFIKWYEKKRDRILQKNPLWKLRVFFVHKGFVESTLTWEAELYVPPSSVSGGTSTAVTPETKFEVRRRVYVGSFTDKEILATCEKGFYLMEKIVKEAFR